MDSSVYGHIDESQCWDSLAAVGQLITLNNPDYETVEMWGK